MRTSNRACTAVLMLTAACGSDTFNADAPDTGVLGDGANPADSHDGTDLDGSMPGDGAQPGDGGVEASAMDAGCGAIGTLPTTACMQYHQCLWINPSTKVFEALCKDPYACQDFYAALECHSQSECFGSSFPDCCYQLPVDAGGCSTVIMQGVTQYLTTSGTFAGTKCEMGCSGRPRICSTDADCGDAGTHCLPVTVEPLDASPPKFGLCL